MSFFKIEHAFVPASFSREAFSFHNEPFYHDPIPALFSTVIFRMKLFARQKNNISTTIITQVIENGMVNPGIIEVLPNEYTNISVSAHHQMEMSPPLSQSEVFRTIQLPSGFLPPCPPTEGCQFCLFLNSLNRRSNWASKAPPLEGFGEADTHLHI